MISGRSGEDINQAFGAGAETGDHGIRFDWLTGFAAGADSRGRTMKRKSAIVLLWAFAWDIPAFAADASLKMPAKAASSAVFDWTGFYVGGHVGYGGGSFGPGTNPLPEQGVFFPHSLTGLIGGYQAGYNIQLPNHVVLGAEADVSFGSPLDAPRLVPAPFNTTFDYIATARGRVGYSMGAWMPYVTGGMAWGQTHVNLNDLGAVVPPKRELTHVGWTAGIGVEFAVGGNWTAKAEYDYIDLARRAYDLRDVGLPIVNVDPSVHAFKVGLNYRLWGTPPWVGPASAVGRTAPPEPTDWNVHAQTTFLPSAYPAMRSPYEGPNSLPGGGQGRETWTTTAFLGWRLWQGGEFYFNPELAQGFGLNSTLGLAGFPNGEAQKAGAAFPKFRPQRYYLRQTFGLGGEQEDVADAANQLPGKRDIDRITVIVGRFAVGDFFDGNSYAKDPRADFMNWAMWSSAAYDFPADLPGYTRGAVVELNRKDWAVRAGLFEVPSAPNSDVLTFKTGGAVLEFEGRYAISGSARQATARHFRQSRQYRQLSPGNRDRECRPDARHQRCRRRHPARQPEIRILRQRRAAGRQGHRRVRPRKLERRPERDPVVHRHRPQPVWAACPLRAAIGVAQPIRSASAARSMACPAPTAISWQRAASAC